MEPSLIAIADSAEQLALEGRAERALQTLEGGLVDAIAVLGLPEKYRRRLRSTMDWSD